MKTAELTGAQLDYAVAIAAGIPAEEIRLPRYKSDGLWRYLRDEETGELNGRYMTGPDLLFSRKWEAGGPIIEREKIRLYFETPERKGAEWLAKMSSVDGWVSGPTPLIAAMRCFVASKLGDEVDLPKELQ